MKFLKLFEVAYKNVSKPPELKDTMDGVSLGKDKKGWFVYTHRARSKSKQVPEKITKREIRFIRSTG